MVETPDADEIRRMFAASDVGGIIVTAAHVGNNDLIGAAIAHMGLPVNVVADDSAFPELFDYLRRQREQWSATLIPWRNLRAIFGVLRRQRGARPARRLGLPERRDPGPAVRRLDDAPRRPGDAGGQDLVAHRAADRPPPARRPVAGHLVPTRSPWRSNDPAELQRATQAIADAVADGIRPAPEQWYSFKPIWPASAAEAADLERRALEMQAGRPDPGPSRSLPRDEADQVDLPADAGTPEVGAEATP